MSEGLDPPESTPPIPPAREAEPSPPAREAEQSRPRSHRAETSATDPVRRFLAPLAAVTSVVVVIVLLLVLNGPGRSSDGGPALQPPPVVATSTAPAATRTTAPPVKRSERARPQRTAPAKEPRPTATAAVQRLPVTVLNNSTRYHLAAQAADQLRAGGWPIKLVGNFTGRIPVSTVYYGPGQEPVAAALAKQFPAVARVHPRFDGLPGSGVTLVVTREWPVSSS